MMKILFSKAARVVYAMGKVTVFCAGLAVVVGLVFGAASVAEAKVPSLRLGVSNTVKGITTMVGSIAGPVLRLDNNSNDANATGLDIQVKPGQDPITVNSDARVEKLNADKLDDKDSGDFHTPRLWAVIGSDGALLRGNGVTAVDHDIHHPACDKGGCSEVVFDQDISQCAYLATAGGTGWDPTSSTEAARLQQDRDGEEELYYPMRVAPLARDARGVAVSARNTTPDPSADGSHDTNFTIVVFC